MSENDMNQPRPDEPDFIAPTAPESVPVSGPVSGPAHAAGDQPAAEDQPDSAWRPSVPAAESGAHASEPDESLTQPVASAPPAEDSYQSSALHQSYESPYGQPAAAYPTASYPTSDAAPSQPTSGAAAPGHGTPGYGTPGYQTPGYITPGYPAAGAPAADHTASYPVSGYPAGSYPPAGYPAPGYPTTGGPYAGPTGPTGPTEPTRSRSRAGRTVGAVVLLLLLMLGSGVVGGLITRHSDDSGTRVANGVVVDNAPPIDRSSLAGIASAVRPSVVSITTGTAEGSGVVLSADGYILTNNHVAATAAGKDVDITFSDGSSAKATLVGTDPKTDLAVFKANNLTKQLTVAKFGDSSALQVGDTVLAIGSPLGLNGSVTEGIVSALNRTIAESSDSQPQDPFSQDQSQSSTQPTATIAGAIQTDASINPGNSGGALVNMNGEVVGINTAIATSPDGSDGSIGVGFAIPSNRAKEVADDLIKGTAVSHPYLGIGVVTADGNSGASVQSVTDGSPAATAGLQNGDVITAFNGTPIYTSDDLINAVQASTVGTSVALTVTRGTARSTINVTLGESK